MASVIVWHWELVLTSHPEAVHTKGIGGSTIENTSGGVTAAGLEEGGKKEMEGGGLINFLSEDTSKRRNVHVVRQCIMQQGYVQ